jgi:hypothetical protein
MKVHLVKSKELNSNLFTKVVDLLQAITGQIEFCCNKESVVDIDQEDLFIDIVPNQKKFEKQDRHAYFNMMTNADSLEREFPLERQVVSWDTLFKNCNAYRNLHKIDNDSFVILLTDIANNKNWFACLDENNPFNGFVHTADWDHFIDCPPQFPIAYEVMALVFQKHMFNGFFEMRTSVHQRPIGCVNDLCIDKREIILKLRTADICGNCMKLLKNKMSVPEIHHGRTVMESLRTKMLFAQNFKQGVALSKLLITKQNRIFLSDFGNIEIKLRPLEKALYYLFLHHPNGIYLSALPDHREQLNEIYTHLSHNGGLTEMRERINELVNPLANSANEKISRIKRIFEEAIGPDLAQDYIIKGESGRVRKIEIDRGLLIFES